MLLDYFDRTAVEVAVGKCEQFNYANSVSAMKALALNPRGICRDDAIKIAVRFGPIDDSTTEFVESVMTNSASYTFRERCRASDQYAWRLLMFDAGNSVHREIRDAGVRMFCRNRLLESGETRMADRQSPSEIPEQPSVWLSVIVRELKETASPYARILIY